MKDAKTSFLRIPSGIWALGFVSLLMDVSSELIHSLLPVFMVSALGASAVAVGVLEGMAEATALIVKMLSGALSDYLGKRKVLAVAGYGLGALSKPLFAMASGIGMVFAARFIDRIGKGVRGAPRDALIADIAPSEVRGAAYGLRQSLDTVGAFMGPLLAIVLMLLWKNQFQAVFWVAVIPGMLSVVVLIFGVREPQRVGRCEKSERRKAIRWQNLKKMNARYWWVVGLGGIFTLARFSEAFLILRVRDAGLPIAWAPLVLVTMNIVYAASAYPLGKLSDRMSHPKLLILGLVTLIIADLMLAFGGALPLIFTGIALWGLHMGMSQGLLATMVADAAPVDLRGTAFGFFNLVAGLMMLSANVVAGTLWDRFGATFTFGVGACFAGLVLFGMAVMPKRMFQALASIRSDQR